MRAVTVAMQLILLHQIDSREIYLASNEITSLVTPRADTERLIHPDARCIVSLSDRHYYAVTETCTEITRLLGARR